MPELSIIVPVYKVEPFLSKCVESILAQAFPDFELILVDDGSPDRCGTICDEYAARDCRIVVIHQKNQGVSTARNAGLNIATGRYISFVDADDAIAPDMYQAMLAKAQETGSEIICCGVQYYSENGTYRRSDLQKEFVCDREQMLSALYDCPDPLGGSCCNKLFLAETIAGLRYQAPIALGEDWLFLFASFEQANRLYKMPDPFYLVTEHPNSAARKTELRIPVQILYTSKKMLALAKAHSFALGNKAVSKYLDDCMRYIKQIRKNGAATHKPYRYHVFRWKCSMARELLLAWIRRRLPKDRLHGFLFGMLKT